MRLNAHFDAQLAPRSAQPHLLVKQNREMVNPVQNGLNFQLHCWPLVSSSSRSSNRCETKGHCFSFCAIRISQPTNPRGLFAGAGERRQWTFELQFALPPVATRNGLAPPLRIGAPANDRKGKILVRLPPNSATDSGFERSTAVILQMPAKPVEDRSVGPVLGLPHNPLEVV